MTFKTEKKSTLIKLISVQTHKIITVWQSISFYCPCAAFPPKTWDYVIPVRVQDCHTLRWPKLFVQGKDLSLLRSLAYINCHMLACICDTTVLLLSLNNTTTMFVTVCSKVTWVQTNSRFDLWTLSPEIQRENTHKNVKRKSLIQILLQWT